MDSHNQAYVSDKSSQPYSLANSGIINVTAPAIGEIAKNGSGSDYLSNEYFLEFLY